MAVIALCSSSSMLRRNLVSSLRRFGHELLETDSSIGLVSACLTRHVDVAVIDCGLDMLPTPAAIRCLRCSSQTRDMTVISLGNTVTQLHEAIQAGADHGLAKPVEMPIFLKLILKVTQPPIPHHVS